MRKFKPQAIMRLSGVTGGAQESLWYDSDAVGSDVTKLLVDWSQGDQAALEQLTPLVYHDLHQRARNYLRHERPDHTLQPTALIHEAASEYKLSQDCPQSF